MQFKIKEQEYTEQELLKQKIKLLTLANGFLSIGIVATVIAGFIYLVEIYF
jgi:hypothetical protein